MFQEANECIERVILGTWAHPRRLCLSNPRHLLGWHNSARWPASVQVTPDVTSTVWLAQSHRNQEAIAMALVLLFATMLDVSLTTYILGEHWNRRHRGPLSSRFNAEECEGLKKIHKK